MNLKQGCEERIYQKRTRIKWIA